MKKLYLCSITMLSIASYSTELQASLNVGGYKVKVVNPLQITNNDKLTDNQKKKAQEQAMQAMMEDIAASAALNQAIDSVNQSSDLTPGARVVSHVMPSIKGVKSSYSYAPNQIQTLEIKALTDENLALKDEIQLLKQQVAAQNQNTLPASEQ